jgi:signal peptidase
VDAAAISQGAASLRARGAFRYLRGAIYWLAVAGASLILGAVFVTIGARLFGCQPYVMLGGSMGSEAPVGSVAFVQDVPAETLKVGDVILFQPPSAGEISEPMMHRIVSIEEVDGQRVFMTKGDANGGPDPWKLTINGEGGRLAYVIPYVGYLLWLLQTRLAWAVAVLAMAAYLGFVALRRIWAPVARRNTQNMHTP